MNANTNRNSCRHLSICWTKGDSIAKKKKKKKKKLIYFEFRPVTQNELFTFNGVLRMACYIRLGALGCDARSDTLRTRSYPKQSLLYLSCMYHCNNSQSLNFQASAIRTVVTRINYFALIFEKSEK